MGGLGSGRPAVKRTVTDCRCLNVAILKRCRREGLSAGRVTWFNPESVESRGSVGFRLERGHLGPVIRLSYVVGEQTVELPIRLHASRPHLGGERLWFSCPATAHGRPCLRSVAKLFLPPGASLFACRLCHKLIYQSCRESHKWDVLIRRAGWTLEEGLRRLRVAIDQQAPCRRRAVCLAKKR
jgi:hypothetical protein